MCRLCNSYFPPWTSSANPLSSVYTDVKVPKYDTPSLFMKKKRIHFGNTPRHSPNIRILNWIPHPVPAGRKQTARLYLHQWLPGCCCITTIHLIEKKFFFTWWPWPLTYDLDLRTWPRYPSTWPPCQNSGPYVCLFTRESETHTQTHR